jgi:protein arginine N-methyltransferase 7
MPQGTLSEAIESFRRGDLQNAEANCELVLQLNPGHAEANHLLGAVRFQQGRTKEALSFLKRATASPLATAEMHNHLGSAYYRLGQKPEARDCFERALAVTPGYAEALHNLGVIYAEMQMGGQAIAAFREAARLDPNLSQADEGLKLAYGNIVSPWHFAMLGDERRNSAYEAAIQRVVAGKNVLEIGTGAGLLALMAARAGAAKVTTCETIPLIAERAREIVGRNGFADRITVVPKKSTLLSVPADMPRRAEVLITETFASGLITEGALSAIEHAHESLLASGATVIPRGASIIGYLAGGRALQAMLFTYEVAGFDLSPFNEFGPPMLPANLDHVPHSILSRDTELIRFDFQQTQFPAGESPVEFLALNHGICVGVVQWIRLELDSLTTYENRPSRESDFVGHWSHIVHRFPRPLLLKPGDRVPVLFRHDRSQISIRLLM